MSAWSDYLGEQDYLFRVISASRQAANGALSAGNYGLAFVTAAATWDRYWQRVADIGIWWEPSVNPAELFRAVHDETVRRW